MNIDPGSDVPLFVQIDLGTAVNVQSMVFGNKGNTSATGVAFTRNPANGEKEFYGDYLVNAQGEDVVAGIRNTSPIDQNIRLNIRLSQGSAPTLSAF